MNEGSVCWKGRNQEGGTHPPDLQNKIFSLCVQLVCNSNLSLLNFILIDKAEIRPQGAMLPEQKNPGSDRPGSVPSSLEQDSKKFGLDFSLQTRVNQDSVHAALPLVKPEVREST